MSAFAKEGVEKRIASAFDFEAIADEVSLRGREGDDT
jgi:hypothetical protein